MKTISNWQLIEIPDTNVKTITIELPSDRGNEYQEKSCTIQFSVEAVQANAYTFDSDFEISGKDDLLGFRDEVNAGTDFTGKVVSLTSNIDLAGTDWYPIGTTANPFRGTFDGCEHTISNLSHSGAFTGTQFGLFGVTNGTANSVYNSLESVWQNEEFVYDTIAEANYTTSIKNINLSNINFVNDSESGSNRYTGGLVGVANHTYIENIGVTGSVTGTKGIGGIVGALEGSILKNCENEAEIVATGYNVGGLVGGANYLTSGRYNAIVDSLNKGNVTTSSTNGYAGGIIGMAQGYNLIVVNDCDNSGTVKALGASDCLGGIVGQGLHCGLINDCYNSGSIVTTVKVNYVGGICGKGTPKVYNSTNAANINANAEYLTGIFTYDTNEGGSQGFAKNCTNTGVLTNSNPTGKTYDLVANGKELVIINKTFADVNAVKEAIINNNVNGIKFVDCTVTDNSGKLELNSSIQSVAANTKICSDVDVTTANQSSLTIDIPNLSMATANYPGTLIFAGESNNIAIANGVTVGRLEVEGNNSQFEISGEINSVSLNSDGTIIGEITTGGVIHSLSFANTGTYVITNRGLISHTSTAVSQHTVSTITACTITINNYGTIEALKNPTSGVCLYACLFYNGCTVKVHQYYGSEIRADQAGMTLACGSANSVIYYTYDASGTLTDTHVYK